MAGAEVDESSPGNSGGRTSQLHISDDDADRRRRRRPLAAVSSELRLSQHTYTRQQ